jgi:hypothetical protein
MVKARKYRHLEQRESCIAGDALELAKLEGVGLRASSTALEKGCGIRRRALIHIPEQAAAFREVR